MPLVPAGFPGAQGKVTPTVQLSIGLKGVILQDCIPGVGQSVSLILVYCPGRPLLHLQCLSNPLVDFVAFCSDDLGLLPVHDVILSFTVI